jgi:hypothetical protein
MAEALVKEGPSDSLHCSVKLDQSGGVLLDCCLSRLASYMQNRVGFGRIFLEGFDCFGCW